MLTTILEKIIKDNQDAYTARRKSIEAKAVELNKGWAMTKYGREGLVNCEPTWGKDDRPHAPFDGYLWENERGEVEAYGGGQYLPYIDEFDRMDKCEYTGDHGWWKLRLTFKMYCELTSLYYIEIQAPYKLWDLGATKAGMCKVRAHTTILKAIQEHSNEVFDNLYAEQNKSKGEAPEGKLRVSGTVVTVKTYEDLYGMVSKMMVRLENGATVYGTLPKGISPEHRGYIEFSATFARAKDDNTHAFFKRPTKCAVEKATV